MNLSPLPIQKFFDNNGRPLVGGLLFSYTAGTSVKIATYVDSSGVTPNTNPVVLDFRGECRLWIDPQQAYKFVLSPRNDTDPPTDPIWTVDNITAAPLAFDNTSVDTGSVNNISLTIPQISSPVAFTRVVFKAANTNTGPTTLQINGGTAADLTWQNLADFSGGEIQEDGIYEAIYDGARWQLQGPTLQPPQMRTAAEIADGVTPTSYPYQPGDSRRFGDSADGSEVVGWWDYGFPATRVSDSSFSVSGDRTAIYLANRRVKIRGTGSTVAYGRILTASFSSPNTTVTLAMDGSSVVPNPATLAPVQITPSSWLPSSIMVDRNDEVYALLVGNRSNGTSAIGKMIVGGGNNLGAFSSAIAFAAVPGSHGEYLPGSGISGEQAVIHTGASIPIVIGTADVLRIYIPPDGSPTVITTDLSINKNALVNSHGEIVLNGADDARIELQSGQVERAIVFSSATEMLVGTVTNIDCSVIQNNTRVLSFNGPNASGSSTPTLSANKPGANAGVTAWLSVKTGNGTQGWIPIFGN